MSGWGATTKELTLPSGQIVTVRTNVPVQALVRRGVFTNDHLEALQSASEGVVEDQVVVFEATLGLVVAAVLEPKLAEPDEDGEVPEGHVSTDEIPDEDVNFIVTELMGGAAEVATFRGDGSSTDGGDGGEVLADATERDDRATDGIAPRLHVEPDTGGTGGAGGGSGGIQPTDETGNGEPVGNAA